MKHEHVGNGWFNLVHCVQSMVDEMNKDQMKTHTRNHVLPCPFACHSTIQYIIYIYIIYNIYIHVHNSSTLEMYVNVVTFCSSELEKPEGRSFRWVKTAALCS